MHSEAGATSMPRPTLIAPQLPPKPQPSTAPALHQYACLRCRSRRVKCDKILSGCAHCTGHGVQCIYSIRRPRKPQKIQQDQTTAQKPLLPASTSPQIPPPTIESRADSLGLDQVSHHTSQASEQSDDDDEDAILPRELRDVTFKARNGITDPSHGRLLVSPHGTSRYINSEKVQEVASLETVLSTEGKNGDAEEPELLNRSENLGAISLLNTSHEKTSMFLYHPPAGAMLVLWDYYCRNVDIMAKVLYKPAMETVVMRASKDLTSVNSTTEMPLLFAIWLATATSMSPDECRQLLGEDRGALIRRYRYALEQSLAQAGWMTTQNILVLQSLALYLVFASESSRSTWILNGIALSLAQAMGMHSDSSLFFLSKVETEVRRRVWWMLCQTDIRVAENCGLQPHAPFIMDTKLPMHINDSDLESVDDKVINPRNEFTEMTLSLGKIEMAQTNLQFKRSTLAKEERDRIVHDQLQRYEDTYLKYFNVQSELHRLYYLGIRLMMTRLWKMMHDTTDHRLEDDGFPEPLILYNADVLEIAHQLPCKYRHHGWFFRCKYTQWHAVAYLLLQMCTHTQGPAVDRAWQVLDATFADWEEGGIIRAPDNCGPRGNKAVKELWLPLLRLLRRAREAKKQALLARHGEMPADTPSTLSIGDETSNMTTKALPHYTQLQEGLIGDPFFGSVEDLNMNMNWEQLDDWVQNFQDDLYQHRTEYDDKNAAGALGWW